MTTEKEKNEKLHKQLIESMDKKIEELSQRPCNRKTEGLMTEREIKEWEELYGKLDTTNLGC